ncbi:metal-sensitive transcriptional regulator [Candidatus Dojkabacteria bacterium]|uniref:Metal-sensitive transcriptional regulator n=1 Tax=Candidatus Dojkabacteria bacterium TaxID=2099670 RepID=A0A955I853_9BACT|nr:metal-sensitive transcriptional regulator [Candidatus Dojkabacteria bacterium]
MKKEYYQKWLRRIEGQIKGIERMLEDERECLETVNQIQAVRASLSSLAQKVLEDEVSGCMQHPNRKSANRFRELVAGFLKLN